VIADLETIRASPAFGHRADDLMSRHDIRLMWRKLGFADMQIRPANAAGFDADEDFTACRPGRWKLAHRQRAGINRAGLG
jgi:hypothetical protein